MLKKLFKKIVKSNRKTWLLYWESIKKKKWATLTTFVNSKKFVPGGYHKN